MTCQDHRIKVSAAEFLNRFISLKEHHPSKAEARILILKTKTKAKSFVQSVSGWFVRQEPSKLRRQHEYEKYPEIETFQEKSLITDCMHVLCLLSDLSYASDNEIPCSLFCLKLIYLGSAVNQFVREKKLCYICLCVICWGHSLTYVSPSKISQSALYAPLTAHV